MKFFYLLVLLIGAAELKSQSANSTLEQAKTAYEAGNYEEAASLYESLVKEGYQSADLFYNIGNAYYRSDNLGKAILNYERALKWDPGFLDAGSNLDLANDRMQSQMEPLPEFFVTAWYYKTGQSLSSNTWAIGGILLLFFGVVGLVIWLLGANRSLRKWSFLSGLALIVVSIVMITFAFSRSHNDDHSSYAIVMVQEALLLNSISGEEQSTAVLPEGAKVKITGKRDNWLKVRAMDGKEGWLPAHQVEEI